MNILSDDFASIKESLNKMLNAVRPKVTGWDEMTNEYNTNLIATHMYYVDNNNNYFSTGEGQLSWGKAEEKLSPTQELLRELENQIHVIEKELYKYEEAARFRYLNTGEHIIYTMLKSDRDLIRKSIVTVNQLNNNADYWESEAKEAQEKAAQLMGMFNGSGYIEQTWRPTTATEIRNMKERQVGYTGKTGPMRPSIPFNALKNKSSWGSIHSGKTKNLENSKFEADGLPF